MLSADRPTILRDSYEHYYTRILLETHFSIRDLTFLMFRVDQIQASSCSKTMTYGLM